MELPVKTHFLSERTEDCERMFHVPGLAIEPCGLDEARLVISTSWRLVPSLPGKLVACVLEGTPFRALGNPEFRALPELVDLWLVGSRAAEREARLLGWRCVLIPVRAAGSLPAGDGAVIGPLGGTRFFVELARSLSGTGWRFTATGETRAALETAGVPCENGPAGVYVNAAHDDRALLAAVAGGARVVSAPLGLAEELLPRECLFRSLAEAVSLFSGQVAAPDKRVLDSHGTEAAEAALRAAFAQLATLDPGERPVPAGMIAQATPGLGSRLLGKLGLRGVPGRVSFLREFVKPPYGGGNQFMLALKDAFERRGVPVAVNEVGGGVRAYYFDSLWFQPKLLEKLARNPNAPVVHRIDGPIYLYRGKDRDLDDKIFAVNRELATATVIQSDFTLTKIYESGYRPRRPMVIRNAANPGIFHGKPAGAPKGRKVRIIASSWSDNPNKGGPVYKWLDEHLDYGRYEFTFVGRCSEELTRARVVEPVASERLAQLLREHDIYVTASQNDPCSNALVEALSCGLPAVALRSGGHPELVGFGGLCFDKPEELPACLDEIALHYESYQRLLAPPMMDETAASYLAAGEP